MSAFKGTPGPWAEGKEIAVRAIDTEGLGYSLVFVNTDSAARKEVCAANARLIAAAPDLLEALQWCANQGWVRYSGRTGSNERFCDAVDKVHAAITKATGDAS